MGVGRGEKYEKCPKCGKKGVYPSYGYPARVKKACRYCNWCELHKEK